MWLSRLTGVIIILSLFDHSNAAAIIFERRMIRAASVVPTLKNGNGRWAPITSTVRTIAELRHGSSADCRQRGNCTTTFPPLDGYGNWTSQDGNETVLHRFLEFINPNLLCLDYRGPFPISLKRYDPKTQICCNGLYNRTKPTKECCNGNLIDTDEEACCNDQRVAINGSVGCCGTRLYDKNDTICCGSTLARKTKYSVCCGDRVISGITEICCDSRAHVKSLHAEECCGTSLYNTHKQTCCDGVVRPRLGQNGEYEQCCGKKSYDPRCFTCSADLVLRVNGNTIANGTCCDGMIILRRGETVCCENGTEEKECRPIVVSDEQIDGDGENITIIIIKSGIASLVVAACMVCSITCLCRRRVRKIKHHRTILDDKYQLLPDSAGSNEINTIEPTNSASISRMSRGSSLASSRLNVLLPIAYDYDQSFDDNYVNDDVTFVLNYHEVEEVINAISKPKTQTNNVNEIEDHFKDIACQTINKENACNRRTIFGRAFTQSCILDTKQPTFKMEHSEVSVQLPISALKDPIEMHGSSFNNIPLIHEKIYIRDSESLASPVVEYLLTGDITLSDYAVVTIPYLASGDQITVWKFMSDDGMQTKVKPFEVPLKKNANPPVFYQIEGNRVKIFTKTFSGFFITTRKHNRGPCLNLRAFLFGSHKRINGQHEARLMLYIADEIMIFEDYKKPMFDREASEGRTVIKEQVLHLTDKVWEDDILRATLILYENEAQTWKHQLHPRTGVPLYPETRTIAFEEIVQRCQDCEGCHFRHKSVPYCIEWYLRTSANGQGYLTDVFKCFVDVDCVKLDTHESKNNVILVDELHLRPEDRYPYMVNDANRIASLQRFLIHLDAVNQAKFVEKMKERYHCAGSEISHIFDDLQRKMKTVGVYEAVVDVLRVGHMYEHIDALQKTGILEERYFPKPTQRVSIGSEESPLLPSPSHGTQRPFAFGLNTIAPADETADVNMHVTHAYSKTDSSRIQDQNTVSDILNAARDPTQCRNELGSDLPICSYDRDGTSDGSILAHLNERPIQSSASTVEMTSNTFVKQTAPIQEIAEEEDTCLKSTCVSESESENEIEIDCVT